MVRPVTDENYLQKLFIDEAKGLLYRCTGGSGSVDPDNIATDEEVNDVIDDIFGDKNTDESQDNIATDKEVDDMVSDVFG